MHVFYSDFQDMDISKPYDQKLMFLILMISDVIILEINNYERDLKFMEELQDKFKNLSQMKDNLPHFILVHKLRNINEKITDSYV